MTAMTKPSTLVALALLNGQQGTYPNKFIVNCDPGLKVAQMLGR